MLCSPSSICRKKSDGQSEHAVHGLPEWQSATEAARWESRNLGKELMDVFLSGDWVTYTPKPEPVLLTDVLRYAPSKHPDFEKQQMQAMITLDMFELQAKHEVKQYARSTSDELEATEKGRCHEQDWSWFGAGGFRRDLQSLVTPVGVTFGHIPC